MDKLRLLSLFSGIGAFEMALRNIEIDYELVNFCENDKYAIKAYCAIHDVDESLNLGDITKINIENLPKDIDLITHGSPCQDFSVAGLQRGGDEGSKTRSSLMWNTVEIIKHCKPKYVIWENVKNVLSKKHKHNFDKYLKTLELLGYTNYWDVLNSKHYGIPQNRERVFVISILDEHKPYKFPESKKLNLSITDLLEDYVEDKYYMSNVCIEKMKKYAPKTIEEGIAPTLTTELSHSTGKNVSPKLCKVIGEYRRITPREAFRLMGVSDIDIDKLQRVNIPETQQYKMAGNSIVVNVLEEIFKNLFEIND